MSVTLIKAQLVSNLQAVTNFVQVAGAPKFRAPTNAECPAAIIDFDDPWMTATPIANSLYQYRWNFTIAILISPVGAELIQDWAVAAEPIPAALITRFAAHNTLANTATSIVFDMNFPRPTLMHYQDTDYYGFIWRMQVFENLAVSFTP